jgi:4'-phosphopantetheinyl transferase
METAVFTHLLQRLPPFVQDQALRYRKWQDQQRCVVGKNLLMMGLKDIDNAAYSLHNLTYSALSRPIIDSTVDFNIAHAHDFTVCVISTTTKVGIDIEKNQTIDISDFRSQFSKTELDELSQAPDSHHAFYTLWTQKEAFLKAIGTGLNTPLNRITIQNNSVVWNNNKWFLQAISLHKDYLCHLCTSTFSPTIVSREIQFALDKAYEYQ